MASGALREARFKARPPLPAPPSDILPPNVAVRIVRVITRLNIGGPARHVILLNQALNDGASFCSTLVTGSTAPHEGDMSDLARQRGVQPVTLPALGREISPMDDLVSLAKLVQLIRRVQPDVVHTHMAKAGTIGRLAARLCNVPLIVHTYHGHVFHGYFSPLKTRVFMHIEHALGMATHRIITVGEGQRAEIASLGIAPLDKLIPIRLGLELGAFLDAERFRGSLRAELGVPEETRLVGIVARLVPIKAHEVFFEAARHVRQQIPDALFLVVGDGERRAELEGLVQRLGLQAAVRFLGWRSDLPRVYADLDVVALTSRNEGSPVALIEALAAARPVVSTNVGGVSEVVVDGATGLTVPPDEPLQLAAAMERLIRDRALAEQLGNAGRRHVYPRYDSSRLVEDMRALYLRELSSRGRAVPSLGVSAG
jgi:glycosyltransferase involved in cell wall biosynthesis